MKFLWLICIAAARLSADPWTFGCNFRATEGYVTDGADDVFCGASELYPTTKTTGNGNSATYGYITTAASAANRSSSLDPKLAGIHYVTGGIRDFQIDLPTPGTYLMSLALGDASAATPNGIVIIRDNTTTLLIIAGDGSTHPASGEFADAHNAYWSSANWPTHNTTRSLTFTTTRVVIETGDFANTTALAHIGITAATTAPGRVVTTTSRWTPFSIAPSEKVTFYLRGHYPVTRARNCPECSANPTRLLFYALAAAANVGDSASVDILTPAGVPIAAMGSAQFSEGSRRGTEISGMDIHAVTLNSGQQTLFGTGNLFRVDVTNQTENTINLDYGMCVTLVGFGSNKQTATCAVRGQAGP